MVGQFKNSALQRYGSMISGCNYPSIASFKFLSDPLRNYPKVGEWTTQEGRSKEKQHKTNENVKKTCEDTGLSRELGDNGRDDVM